MTHPLNDLVFCKLAPSPIHGIGIFAIRDIPKGKPLFGGDKFYSREHEETILPEIKAIMQDRFIYLEKFNVLPNPNWDAENQRFMNHSRFPNSNGYCALTDIKKGDEVTEDYTNFADDMGPEAMEHYKDFLV